MGANFLSAEEIFLVRRLISSFSGFMVGCFLGWGVCLFGLDCRFSQTSPSLLAKNVISERNVIFISSLSFAPLVDYFPYKGWERKEGIFRTRTEQREIFPTVWLWKMQL